jgi:tripartite-type tricarboxylate transporter receptor subunit TctC
MLARVLAICAMLSTSAPCLAQETYPTRPVRIVVAFPAGTPPDLLARIASQKLAESWASPVVVEIRDGASGTIAANHIVRSAADGYTLLFTNDFPITMAPALSKTPYDSRKDLAPIAAVAQGNSVLVVHPSMGASSVKDLIAIAKARPAALTFATSGVASTSHMCVELIKRAAGIDLLPVPYKGAAPAIQAVLSGEVSMYCSPAFQALPHVRSGKLIALGTTGAQPSPLFPAVRPMSSQGLPEVVLSIWYAAFAHANTPPSILTKIRESFKKVFDDAEVRQRLAAVALDPIWVDAAQLSALIATDIEKWTAFVQKAGIKSE